ncbi:MAG: hypothetical protein V4719_04150 [Planctomycetota bacterium]
MVEVEKPERPPGFPLYAHASKRWAKKIRGRVHYFGPWRDPDAALEKFYRQWDDLKAGRTPRVQGDGPSIVDVVNKFLTNKENRMLNGELSPRTFHDYHATCAQVLERFGKTRLASDIGPDDFESLRVALSKNRGPVSLGNHIQRVKILFKFAFVDTMNGAIEKPFRYGDSFKKPPPRTLRVARNAKGPRMFEPDQIHLMLASASVCLKAMLLLGVQAGLGNHDVALLPLSALDLDSGWLTYPRPKTAIKRRIPLWTETVEALRAVLAVRPKAKTVGDEPLLFLTRTRQRWIKSHPNGVWADSIAVEIRKLLIKLKLHRPGLGFYAARHVFETIGGESRDQVAVDAIMGHAADSGDMSAAYRERISDERLKAVTDTIHHWLYPPKTLKKKTKPVAKATSSDTPPSVRNFEFETSTEPKKPGRKPKANKP